MFVIRKDADTAWIEFEPGDGTVERYKLKKLNPMKARSLRDRYEDEIDMIRECFVEMIVDWEGPVDEAGQKAEITAENKRLLFDSAASGNDVDLLRVTFITDKLVDQTVWSKVDVENVLGNSNGSRSGGRKATKKRAKTA